LLLFFLQAKLGEHEHELLEMNSNSGTLQQTYNELFEFKLVLSKVVLHTSETWFLLFFVTVKMYYLSSKMQAFLES
jgi:hypothetical protein